MNRLSFFPAAALTLLLTAGCASDQAVKSVRQSSTLNLAADESSRGYVEFRTVETGNGVGIFQLEPQQSPRLVGVIGLSPGTRFRPDIRRAHVPAVETLRVVLAPGTHSFRIESEGETIGVPVVADKVTPVEVDYVVVDRVVNYDVYRVKVRVLDPVAPSEAQRKEAAVRSAMFLAARSSL